MCVTPLQLSDMLLLPPAHNGVMHCFDCAGCHEHAVWHDQARAHACDDSILQYMHTAVSFGMVSMGGVICSGPHRLLGCVLLGHHERVLRVHRIDPRVVVSVLKTHV